MSIVPARIAAAVQPYGFEGIWMGAESCTEPARSAQYFSTHVRCKQKNKENSR